MSAKVSQKNGGSWEEAAKEHIGDAFGTSTAKRAVEFIAENGNTARREDVEEHVSLTGADGGEVVEILQKAYIVSTDRYHGREHVMAQANRNLWKDYQKSADERRKERR